MGNRFTPFKAHRRVARPAPRGCSRSAAATAAVTLGLVLCSACGTRHDIRPAVDQMRRSHDVALGGLMSAEDRARLEALAAERANGPAGEVFTLAEAAAYLRLPEKEVVRLIREQALPARQAGSDWRFLKTAIP